MIKHSILIVLTFTLFSCQQKKAEPQKENPLTTVFRTLDVDHNGKLTPNEIESAPARLKTLDLNQNNSLEENEIGGPTKMLGMVRTQLPVRVIDQNGDLSFSNIEIEQAANALKRLDKNHNDTLETEEINPPQETNEAVANMMKELLYYEDTLRGEILPGADERQYEGYMLYQGSNMVRDIQISNLTYLANAQGEVVHTWPNKRNSPEGVGAYLLENGLLLRASCNAGWLEMHHYPVGAWNYLELVDWEGNIVWEYHYSDENSCLHHDIEPLPNGNILVNAYEGLSKEEAQAIGWKYQEDYKGLVWFESLYELKPNLQDGSTEIVWEWHSWDHVIQDDDSTAANYGSIADNLKKFDVNYEELGKKVYSRGQVIHFNSVSYNADVDQILVSACIYGEFWIIDHNTSTEEAQGEKGDLLYRWGRPEVVDAGTPEDNILYWQHDVSWIPSDVPHQGEVMIFNNGSFRDTEGNYRGENQGMGFGRTYSDILEVKLPVNKAGEYELGEPAEVVWDYNSIQKSTDFYSPFMSGARRLPNGNTIAVTAYNKRVVELNPNGEKVMDYYIPGGGQLYRIYKYPMDYLGLNGKL